MTEDEDKTKWCPAFRGNNHGVNRPDELKTNAGLGFCVGSACMAWRTMVYDHQRNLPDKDRTPNVGFCGLAGKP